MANREPGRAPGEEQEWGYRGREWDYDRDYDQTVDYAERARREGARAPERGPGRASAEAGPAGGYGSPDWEREGYGPRGRWVRYGGPGGRPDYQRGYDFGDYGPEGWYGVPGDYRGYAGQPGEWRAGYGTEGRGYGPGGYGGIGREGWYGATDWWRRGFYREPNWRGEPWRQPGPYTGRGPRGYQRSDERIQEEVCARLTQHGGIDATDVDVSVENGEVTLSGTVESRVQKRLAEDAAESVPGVRDVHNRLRIQAQDRVVG